MAPHVSTNLLKIPSDHGSPINEYRISQGQIEFRSLDSQGKPFPHNAGSWTALNASDLQLHFVLNTEVARWLIGRLEVRASGARAAPMDST